LPPNAAAPLRRTCLRDSRRLRFCSCAMGVFLFSLERLSTFGFRLWAFGSRRPARNSERCTGREPNAESAEACTPCRLSPRPTRAESIYSVRATAGVIITGLPVREATTIRRSFSASLCGFNAALLVLGLAVVRTAQPPAATPAQEWRTYDHDLSGTRFSPLTEINSGNVARLAQSWTFNLTPPP